jgi:hypothetical protein
MDELTLVRTLHRDTPGPSPAETAAARARLLDAMGNPQSRPSRMTASGRHLAVLGLLSRRRFWAPVAAAAAVTAVAITAAVIAAPGPRPPRPGTSVRPVTAASVLLQAASAAARQTPGHGHFYATEFENIDIYGYPPNPVVTYWIGNGVSGRLAWLNGRVASPLPEEIMSGYGLTWAKLQRLPTAPGQLQAELVKAVNSQGIPAEPLAATEFSLIANLLARAPVSPALRSGLYQVAARLPGLALVLHTHDLIGRAAAEVYVPRQQAGSPTGQALYFDPSTGAALDVAGFGPDPHCPDLFQDAVLASGYVASTYQLPVGAVRTPRPVPQVSMFPGCGVYYTPPPTPVPTPTPPGPTVTPTTPGSTVAATTPGHALTPTPTPLPAPTASKGNAAGRAPRPHRHLLLADSWSRRRDR